MKVTLLYKQRNTFEYEIHWRDAFIARKDLKIIDYHTNDFSYLELMKMNRSDLIVLLHSFDRLLSEAPPKRQNTIKKFLKYRKGKLIFFPRNEYANFLGKRELIKELKVDTVVSSLTLESAKYLYEDLTKVISMPYVLNSDIYYPKLGFSEREIMIGNRGDKYPLYLLDNCRNSLIDLIPEIQRRRKNWVIDFNVDTESRLSKLGWADFLNHCKFTISTEAGAAYVDKTDKLQLQIKEITDQNNNIDIEELKKRFEHELKFLPTGKHIASRHFDAIGCKTCLILVEGAYNGILKPDVHYIELKKDFSNLDEVLEKMEDEALVKEIIENAYELAINKHTHRHRVNELLNQI